jgi:tetratricopeptide (TPR) repeat protein
MTSSQLERFRRDGCLSRVRGFRGRCAVAFLLLAATPLPMTWAAGRKYVDRKNGFQLEVPKGWKKVKAVSGPLPGAALVAFAVQKKNLGIAIMRLKSPVGAAEAATIDAALKGWSRQPGYRKLSEGVATLSGLSARKIVFDSSARYNQVVRCWALFVFGHEEVWLLFIQGPERWLSRPGNAHALQLKAVIQSFKFLEPTLSHLQSEAFARETISTITNAVEAVALTAHGQYLEQEGRRTEAISAWREALRLDPKEADAHFRLAVALASNLQTRPEAPEHFKAFLKYC